MEKQQSPLALWRLMPKVRNLLAGKKILVTGHTGFKGSWLTLLLHDLGADVYGYALPENPKNSAYTAMGITGILKGESLKDILDERLLSSFVCKIKPDFIFHLAAQALVLKSYEKPKETIAVNLIGTTNLLESLRKFLKNTPCLIVTSDKCYQNPDSGRRFRENNPLGGHDVYSMSKACQDLIAQSYRNSFSLKLATARSGNIIGGGDYAENRIIPDCVKAFAKNKAVFLRNPNSTRPWQFVLDPLWGYVVLASQMMLSSRFNAEWNFGPMTKNSIPVKSLAQIFQEAFGSGKIKILSSQKQEALTLGLNINKSRKLLGWKPVVPVRQALLWTAQWYQEFEAQSKKPGSMKEHSLGNIRDYLSLL